VFLSGGRVHRSGPSVWRVDRFESRGAACVRRPLTEGGPNPGLSPPLAPATGIWLGHRAKTGFDVGRRRRERLLTQRQARRRRTSIRTSIRTSVRASVRTSVRPRAPAPTPPARPRPPRPRQAAAAAAAGAGAAQRAAQARPQQGAGERSRPWRAVLFPRSDTNPRRGTESMPNPSRRRAILDAPQIWPGETARTRDTLTGGGVSEPRAAASRSRRRSARGSARPAGDTTARCG
jgi:hypothetical protein